MNAKIVGAIAVLLVAIIVLGVFWFKPSFFPFMAISEADLKTRLYLSNDTNKVLFDEPFRAYFDAEWTSVYGSVGGGQKIGFAWFLDNQLISIVGGQTDSVNSTFCEGYNPAVGCIGEKAWVWDTLQYAMVLPPRGSSVSNSWAKEITGIEKGKHLLEIKVYTIQSTYTDIDNQNVFTCGTTNAGCCPLQKDLLEVCNGIYGLTQERTRSESPIYPTPDGKTVKCGSMQWDQCTDTYCQKTWCGGNWCSSRAPSDCYLDFISMQTVCICKNGIKTRWSDWGSYNTLAQRPKEQAIEKIKNATTLEKIEFNVVEKCSTQCCQAQPEYIDKPCLEDEQCVSGTCQKTISPPPTDSPPTIPTTPNTKWLPIIIAIIAIAITGSIIKTLTSQ